MCTLTQVNQDCNDCAYIEPSAELYCLVFHALLAPATNRASSKHPVQTP